MKYGYKPLLIVMALVANPAQLLAAPDEEALTRLLAGERLDPVLVAQLTRQAVLDADGVPALYKRLQQLAASDHGTTQRALARLAQAHVHWSQGEIELAMREVDQALILAPGPDAWWLKAQLFEALGESDAARDCYHKLLTAQSSVQAKQQLTLRLALLDNSDADADADVVLLTWAQSQPASMSVGAQTLLALSGHADAALTLYQTQHPDNVDTRQQLQAATWALAVGRQDQAAAQAWAAFSAADNISDRRYALALWLEAYRDQGKMLKALNFLSSHADNPQVKQARVDVLLELQRYDQAIKLVQADADPVLRQRLLGILELAGRRDAIVAEYQRLIELKPHERAAYDGLAALYLGEDSPQQALEVYRLLFARNPGRVDVLLPAAHQMRAMGLQDQVMELLASQQHHPAMVLPVAMFRFDTLHEQAQDVQAGQVLQSLQQWLPGNDMRRVQIAEGYQRLQRPAQALAVLVELERQSKQLLDYDLQLRMVDLASQARQHDDALARLQRLWTQTRLPARRSLLERKIVRIAQELGKLEELAQTLDAQLASGQSEASQTGLLLALRLAQKDYQGADAAIMRYAGNAESVLQLQQLSDFYTRIGDDDKLQVNLRRLLEQDPSNADQYLRKLALLVLQEAGSQDSGAPGTAHQRLQRIDQLLARMWQMHGKNQDAEASRFAAGLYARAGYGERAIAEYRQAAALAPQDIDSLLQLCEQLQRQQQIARAAALLQYAAEHAADQKNFALLIDGLLGLFANDMKSARRDNTQAVWARSVLQWAQRRVLERIAGSDDRYLLYALLADIAQAQGDFELQGRAYEYSLAEAEEQRPLLLRQLVMLNSGGSGSDADGGPVVGDDRRKLRFGRRLIALKHEFPPAFYADLARTMLSNGDALGAERTFSVMTDIGGLVNLAQIKGDAYATEGYDLQALLNYSQALVREQDNLPLLLKTSILRECMGESGLAHRWYWNGMRSLLLRQSQHDDGMLGDGDIDMQRYAPALVEGLLLTWPRQPEDEQYLLSELRQMFDAAIAQVDPAQFEPLANYPRLAAIVGLLRRIALVRSKGSVMSDFDTVVARTFVGDAQQQADADYYQRLRSASTAVSMPEEAATPAMQALLIQASQPGTTSNPQLAFALASINDDQVAIANLVQRAMRVEQQWEVVGRTQSVVANPGAETFYQLLLQAMKHLPGERFRSMVFAPLQETSFRDKVLFNLYRGAPNSYAELADLLGTAPMSDDTLIRMLVEHGNDPMPFRGSRHAGGTIGPSSMIAHFSIQQQIVLYAKLVEHMMQTGIASTLQQELLQGLLHQPLSDVQQQEVLQIAGKELAGQAKDPTRTLADIAPGLLIFDPLPDNQRLLLQIVARVAVRYPQAAPLPAILQAYFSGDHDLAFVQLQALQSSAEVRSTALQIRIRQFFPEQRQRRIDEFLAAEGASVEQVSMFYREIVLPAINGIEILEPATLMRCYQKLLTLQPDNPAYLAGVLNQQLQGGDLAAFSGSLRGYVQRNPDELEAVSALALAYWLQNKPQDAVQVMEISNVWIDDVDFMVRMINRANVTSKSSAEPTFAQLFLQLQLQFEAVQPQAPVIVALHARRLAEAARSSELGFSLRPLAQAWATHPERAAGELRALWRNSDTDARWHLLNGRFDLQGREHKYVATDMAAGDCSPPTAAPDLLLQMARSPAISDEYEAYLRAMAPAVRSHSQRLYDLLAQGLIAQGQGEVRIAQLQQLLTDRRADAHELQLLTTLAIRSGASLSQAQRRALLDALQALPSASAEQRELLATLQAQSGDYISAGQLLQAAVMQWLYPDMPGSRGYVTGLDPAASLRRLLANLEQWPDRDMARENYEQLIHLISMQSVSMGNGVLAQMPSVDWSKDHCAVVIRNSASD